MKGVVRTGPTLQDKNPFSNYFWYPSKTTPSTTCPGVQGPAGTGTTCHWLSAKNMFIVIKLSLSFYKLHCGKRSSLAQS